MVLGFAVVLIRWNAIHNWNPDFLDQYQHFVYGDCNWHSQLESVFLDQYQHQVRYGMVWFNAQNVTLLHQH